MIKNRIKAVIFDMDGIIIDSEPLQKEAFDLVLKPYNIYLSDEEFKKLIGIRSIENFIDLKKEYDIPLSAEKLTDKKNQYYEEILKKNAEPRDGVIELLSYLKDKYKIALASGSIRADVMNTLSLLKLKKFFSVIVTGDDVINGKPHPEIFLKTAELLNINPEYCAVIEDSENGIKAAHLAGMISIAVPTYFTNTHNFETADFVVNRLIDIKKIL